MESYKYIIHATVPAEVCISDPKSLFFLLGQSTTGNVPPRPHYLVWSCRASVSKSNKKNRTKVEKYNICPPAEVQNLQILALASTFNYL
jgi:hypothetical protein